MQTSFRTLAALPNLKMEEMQDDLIAQWQQKETRKCGKKAIKQKLKGCRTKKRGKKCDGALQGFVLMFFTTRGPSERLS